MRTLAGPTASIAFTNLSSATSASLSAAFSDTNISDSDSAQAQAQAECHKQGVLALMKSCDIDIPLEQVCLLDPKASLALTPSDGDAGKFTWFLFGVRPVPSIHRSSFFLPSFTALSPSVSFSVLWLGFIFGRSIRWDVMGFRVSSVRFVCDQEENAGAAYERWGF
jgi:Predicted SAM-dependent RNA methyltransferase